MPGSGPGHRRRGGGGFDRRGPRDHQGPRRQHHRPVPAHLSSWASAHLSATGQLVQVASRCLGGTLVDMTEGGTTVSFMDQTAAKASILASLARGYMDGRFLAEIFAWLRPDDLIWINSVNHDLREDPAPVRHIVLERRHHPDAAALHRNFIDIAMANALTKPGAASMLVLLSICPTIDSTATSWQAPSTISRPGRRPIAPPSCSAAATSVFLCSPIPGTSSPWSTRRRTRRPPSGCARQPPDHHDRWPRPRRCRAAGGPRTPRG